MTDENGSTRVKFTGTKYEKLNGQNIRVFMPSDFDLSRLTVGHRVLYRYLIYGSHIFWLSDCDDTVFRDIEVEAYPFSLLRDAITQRSSGSMYVFPKEARLCTRQTRTEFT